MKTLLRSTLAALTLAVAVPCVASAQTATQTINYSVAPINAISVSSPTVSLAIASATAGADTASVTDASTTYSVSTNQTGAKITAKLDTDMPTGTQLLVNLGATQGTSAGTVDVSTTGTGTAKDVVTALTQTSDTGAITYTFKAAQTAGAIPSGSTTITFTVTGGV